MSTTIAVTDSNFFFSPYNTYSDGAGSLGINNVRGSSTYIQWNTPGAYFKTKFNGTSVGLAVDTSMIGTDYIVIDYSIDGAAATRYTVLTTDTTISIATGLSDTVHTLTVNFVAANYGANRWTGSPNPVVRITGLVLDTGKALSAPTLKSRRAIVYGDSILEGQEVLGAGVSLANQDATVSFARLLAASSLGLEIGVVGYSAQGIVLAGSGNVPGGTSAWDLYYQSHSRLFSGLFSPAPDYIFLNWGANLDSGDQAALSSLLPSLRTAAPTAKIVVIITWHGNDATEFAAAVSGFGDSNCYCVNTGTTSYSHNSNHLTTAGHAAYEADLLPLIPDAGAGHPVSKLNHPSLYGLWQRLYGSFAGKAAAPSTTLYAKTAGGNWSSANTWSNVSSAGTDNSGPPTSSYDVIFDSGSGNVTIDADATCRSLDCTSGNGNYTGTLTHGATFNLSIGGSISGPGSVILKFSSGMTFTIGDVTTSNINFVSTVASVQHITLAGKSIGPTLFNGAAGSWILEDAVDCRNLTISAGSLDTNGKTITTNTFQLDNGTTVTLGASTINLTRTTTGTAWACGATATFNSGTSNIVISVAGSGDKTFQGSGKTYYDLTYTVAGSTGKLIITGSNTFHNLSFSDVTNARTLQFTINTTTTITGSFNVNGTSGKLMSIITGTGGTAATISKSSGTVSCDYLSIKDSTATGGATFFAGSHSTDVSGNTGWTFSAPTGNSSSLMLLGVG